MVRTSGEALRTSISATPGITCGTRTVTNKRYGPASPSKKTSGLPTCALTEAALERTTTIPSTVHSQHFFDLTLIVACALTPTRTLSANPPHPISPGQPQPRGD